MPIDEMLDDLRSALEVFEANPDDYTYSKVQYETFRIESECEKLLGEDDDE